VRCRVRGFGLCPKPTPKPAVQVRAYTLQSLASDVNLMTPHEEVFSRRGGVKMVLMELEQLRGALAALQPALPSGESLECPP
jgi:hypothetical protein